MSWILLKVNSLDTAPKDPVQGCVEVQFEYFWNFVFLSIFIISEKKIIIFREYATKMLHKAQCFCLTKMLEKMQVKTIVHKNITFLRNQPHSI